MGETACVLLVREMFFLSGRRLNPSVFLSCCVGPRVSLSILRVAALPIPSVVSPCRARVHPHAPTFGMKICRLTALLVLVACAGWAAGDAAGDKLKKLTAERFKLQQKAKAKGGPRPALVRITPPAAPKGPGLIEVLVANLKKMLAADLAWVKNNPKNLSTGALLSLLVALWTNLSSLSDNGVAKSLLTGGLLSLLAALWTDLTSLLDNLPGDSKNLLTGLAVSLLAAIWTNLASLTDDLSGNSKNVLTGLSLSLLAALWTNLASLFKGLCTLLAGLHVGGPFPLPIAQHPEILAVTAMLAAYIVAYAGGFLKPRIADAGSAASFLGTVATF